MILSSWKRVLGAVALSGVLIGTSSTLGAGASTTWASYNSHSRTAYLTVISAYGQDTYNFNGGTRGHFVFTVPLNATVIVKYSNMSMHMPHGAEVVAYNGTLPLGKAPAPAFPGAASPNYLHGTMAGITQTFSFKASKAGTYLLICPVHNHVKFGHWAWFIVSKTATTASGVLK